MLLFSKTKWEGRVLRWIEIDSRAKLESTYNKFLCPSDALILGVTKIPATPSRFQNVQKYDLSDLSVHGWGAKTSADAIDLYTCIPAGNSKGT